MNRLARGLAFVMSLVLLLTIFPSLAEETEEEQSVQYRSLHEGDAGEDVLLLKQRMYDLGYFNTDNFTNVFNATTVSRLKDLQRKNGLPADGVATPDLQAFIFSDACLGKNDPTPAPAPASRAAMPDPAGPDAPSPEADGYLAEGLAPYVYSDRDSGVWTYLSHDIRVEIRQYTDPSVPHVWLVAMIRVRDPRLFTAMVNTSTKTKSTRSGTFLSMPTTIAEKNEAVFACSDDFFGYRILNKQKVGVIIRNGRVWSEKTKVSTSKAFPPLDVMALFEDGHMQTFVSDAHTAEEYLEMGVVSTFAFGPILVQEGAVCEDLQRWSTTDRSPRMAIGMTADGTIIMMDALGRRKDAVGVTFPWLAERMLEFGAVEALNLDGGNTTCMVFMGEIINRPKNVRKKDIRTVNSVIGVREAVFDDDDPAPSSEEASQP